jgi:hypothetical protein
MAAAILDRNRGNLQPLIRKSAIGNLQPEICNLKSEI